MSNGAGSGALSPNFGFLAEHDALLVRYAAQAERYFAEDPATSIDKLRQFIHTLALRTAASLGIYTVEREDLAALLRRLREHGALTHEIADLFHTIRKAGNRSVHEGVGSHRDALHCLRLSYALSVWFHQSIGGHPGYKPARFVVPPDPRTAAAELQAELRRMREAEITLAAERDQAKLTAEEESRQRAEAEASAKRAYEDLTVALELAGETAEKLAALEKQHQQEMEALAAKAKVMPEGERKKVLSSTQDASEHLSLSEADTRKLIDAQLKAAGWEADSEVLRHSKGARPAKGRNMAIAEWPTTSGPADYVLFVGLVPVAAIEAKRHHKSVQGALSDQAQRYARDYALDAGQSPPDGGPWDPYVLPFAFATNGRPYVREVIDASGTWFRDLRRQANTPRALEGWYTPDGLTKLLKSDVVAAEQKLSQEPFPSMLRPFQREAIGAVEAALAMGRREMLLAMATGTGKTITTICLAYRLLKTGRCRRILFLVDRTALGEQAYGSLQHTKLEGLQSFTQIYDVKALDDVNPEADTRLHIATIQSMVRRLFAADDVLEGAEELPVDLYDCIIVDECHRGYNIDADMSEAERAFRSEEDYISKYRRVLDHFDAIKIGLTATPALHTTHIFGRPIYEYSYRQAVIDGWLVDHEPPIQFSTKLSTEGIQFLAGESVPVYTRDAAGVALYNLPDDLGFEVDAFNKQVLSESFNRVVCRGLAEHIDPSKPGKTIIYCLNDLQNQGGVNHCDAIVRNLKEAFQEKYGSVDDRAVVKITSSIKDAAGVLRQFKNERLPSVAVTVDLLTTGVDVPAVDKLVFLRQVRSRILYEQMLGRATRLCVDLYGQGQPKQRFLIFDAVELYKKLEPVSNMKPVVVRPQFSFAKLFEELETVDAAHHPLIRDEIIAKLRSKQRSLGDIAPMTYFEPAAGMSLGALIALFRSSSTAEILQWLSTHPRARALLDEALLGEAPRFYISNHEDELFEPTRGYGAGRRPEDYLEGFGRFIRENINTIPALLLVTQRPRELTRKELRQLELALDAEGYNKTSLRTAWRDLRKQDIAASIIGFIRQQALGSPLIPYDERVERAMQRILARRQWTDDQKRWLQRIGKQIVQEDVVGRQDIENSALFQSSGGYGRIDKVFDGQLEALLGEIQEAVWEDAAG